MKIRLLTNTTGLRKGTEVEVPDKRGKSLVANHHAVEVAEPVEDEKPKKG